jgi:CheY-like chemotaxis protein/anti-sigma regulatory factor (Ser/Thr protein kinase)
MEELPVHLDAVVREAIETVRPFAAARDIHLDATFRDWHDEVVNGDRARLLQAFWNLLHNAIKFSAPGGRVHVECEANDRDAIVRIEDSGQGITPDFLPFVFERFRQADGSKTRAHGGLGLGLSLAKSFVEAHQGTVEAESEGAGRGSRFTVRLPRLGDRVSAAAYEKKEIQAKEQPQSGRLLIIEDDADTLELMQATFETRGFRVMTSQSATDALEVAPKNSIDLIISDIGMPGMDGFEMIKRLRQLPGFQNVPAIALSGYASQKDAATALAAGFSAHVSKPVDPAELVSLVDRLLQNASDTTRLC